MSRLRESPYIDAFPRQVASSIVLHALFVLIFIVRAAIVPSEELLIRNAIRVDMVAMPDKVSGSPKVAPSAPVKPAPVLKPEPAKPEPVIPKKAEQPAPKAPDLAKLKETQRQALEQLKAQSAIEKMKSEMESDAKNKAPAFKGNIINQGDGLTGLERIEFDRYFGDLEKEIKENWKLPGWLIEARLRAQAMVILDGAGQVVKRQIITSSGNEVFDGQVLAAIDGAAPFPEPPPRLKSVLALKGIIFNFPD